MRRRTVAWLAVLAIVSLSGMNGVARAAEKNATGTWKWEQTLIDGQKVEWSLKLKQDGEKLSGTYHAGSRKTKIKDGKIVNDELSFTVETAHNGNEYKVEFTGKIEGDTIKGTTESQRNGGSKQTHEWQAKRAAD